LQYSGAEHGLVRGINVVNLMHSSGPDGDYFPIDYRIYDNKSDGKSKNDHLREMLVRAISEKGIKATTVLFDSWHASVENLKMIHRLNLFFVTTLKSNRRVTLSKASGYIHLQDITWTQEQLTSGMIIKLKDHPYLVRLFKIVATNGDVEWAITNKDITNDLDGGTPRPITAQDVQNQSAVRWQIEQMHRELKQLVGSERCQCRKARSQPNHIACCYHAWLALKLEAMRQEITIYAAQAQLWRNYLREQLKNPQIKAYAG
jgi:hypothetical protein